MESIFNADNAFEGEAVEHLATMAGGFHFGIGNAAGLERTPNAADKRQFHLNYHSGSRTIIDCVDPL